ncbi:flavodoxin [Ferrimonas senticii]|uniref:flavodoxin n=1 Tax=Ferrimonas senticii TaxID=394566 RepID=UPI0003F80208|nr:flavodoxin [Ferrimonas senticii]
MLNIRLIVGSVYGGAEYVAEQVEAVLLAAGHQVSWLAELTEQDSAALNGQVLLVICSTTGAGDLPDNIAPLFFALKDRFPLLPQSHYGVIALGDSSYGETFCGGGRQFDQLLAELGAKRVGEPLQIDACETMEPEIPALEWLQNWLAALSRQPSADSTS